MVLAIYNARERYNTLLRGLKMSDCKCDGWQKNIDHIMNAEVHMNLSHNIEYTGDSFKFCPWCGEPPNKAVEHGQACDCTTECFGHNSTCEWGAICSDYTPAG